MDRTVADLLPAVPCRLFWGCLCCDYAVSALSPSALNAAMEEHVAFVNRTANRAEDPHFELHRLDALMQEELQASR